MSDEDEHLVKEVAGQMLRLRVSDEGVGRAGLEMSETQSSTQKKLAESWIYTGTKDMGNKVRVFFHRRIHL